MSAIQTAVIWSMLLSLPVVIDAVGNNFQQKMFTLLVLYPTAVRMLARNETFTVKLETLLVTSLVTFLFTLSLGLFPRMKGYLKDPENDKMNSAIAYLFVLLVFLIVFFITSRSIGVYPDY